LGSGFAGLGDAIGSLLFPNSTGEALKSQFAVWDGDGLFLKIYNTTQGFIIFAKSIVVMKQTPDRVLF
jgi:hypothetical protein